MIITLRNAVYDFEKALDEHSLSTDEYEQALRLLDHYLSCGHLNVEIDLKNKDIKFLSRTEANKTMRNKKR